MQLPHKMTGVAFVVGLLAPLWAVAAADMLRAKPALEHEDYDHAEMPPGFHVEISELEGPVFADANGKTLYRWPVSDLRNGEAGANTGVQSFEQRASQFDLLGPSLSQV